LLLQPGLQGPEEPPVRALAFLELAVPN